MRIFRTALLIVTLAGTLGISWASLFPVQADTPIAESQPFTLDGTITKVDADRERVILAGDDRRTWTLDTSGTDIVLQGGTQSGETPDLVPGMRVHVSGRRLSPGIAEADHLRVMDSRPIAKDPAKDPARTPVAAPANPVGGDLELRGTVDSLQTRRGAFVVRVRDHTRTIYLADNTDVSGMALSDSSRFPVKPGDRVTVIGHLQPDGSLLAGAVSLSRTIAAPPSQTLASVQSGRILFGRISSPSNRLTGRDIKMRLADGHEVKVKVRRGLPIRRAGRPISVHDLRGDDEVRVTGSFEGDALQADRIDVLGPGGAAGDSAPGQRGL